MKPSFKKKDKGSLLIQQLEEIYKTKARNEKRSTSKKLQSKKKASYGNTSAVRKPRRLKKIGSRSRSRSGNSKIEKKFSPNKVLSRLQRKTSKASKGSSQPKKVEKRQNFYVAEEYGLLQKPKKFQNLKKMENFKITSSRLDKSSFLKNNNQTNTLKKKQKKRRSKSKKERNNSPKFYQHFLKKPSLKNSKIYKDYSSFYEDTTVKNSTLKDRRWAEESLKQRNRLSKQIREISRSNSKNKSRLEKMLKSSKNNYSFNQDNKIGLFTTIKNSSYSKKGHSISKQKTKKPKKIEKKSFEKPNQFDSSSRLLKEETIDDALMSQNILNFIDDEVLSPVGTEFKINKLLFQLPNKLSLAVVFQQWDKIEFVIDQDLLLISCLNSFGKFVDLCFFVFENLKNLKEILDEENDCKMDQLRTKCVKNIFHAIELSIGKRTVDVDQFFGYLKQIIFFENLGFSWDLKIFRALEKLLVYCVPREYQIDGSRCQELFDHLLVFATRVLESKEMVFEENKRRFDTFPLHFNQILKNAKNRLFLKKNPKNFILFISSVRYRLKKVPQILQVFFITFKYPSLSHIILENFPKISQLFFDLIEDSLKLELDQEEGFYRSQKQCLRELSSSIERHTLEKIGMNHNFLVEKILENIHTFLTLPTLSLLSSDHNTSHLNSLMNILMIIITQELFSRSESTEEDSIFQRKKFSLKIYETFTPLVQQLNTQIQVEKRATMLVSNINTVLKLSQQF